MRLRDIEFESCWDAAGVRGWMKEGYWFHRLPAIWHWYDFTGSTFVTKTIVLEKNPGNMLIYGAAKYFAPIETFPKCIWARPFRSRTLNSVGLAGPGFEALLRKRLLLCDTEPFMLSYMAVNKTKAERLADFMQFCGRLKTEMLNHPASYKKIGLQINISCPNTGHDTKNLMDETSEMLDYAGELNIPIVVKINLLMPVDMLKKIAAHPACNAICLTNAIPFGELAGEIDWKKLFPNGSPLARRNPKFGGGGYSGPELVKLVAEYIVRAKDAGISTQWNAGGGIRHADDVDYLYAMAPLEPGMDSIFFASVALTAPWNIRHIIRRAHEVLG